MLHFTKNNRNIYFALLLASIYCCGLFFANVLHPLSHIHSYGEFRNYDGYRIDNAYGNNQLQLTFSHSCFLCNVTFSETASTKPEHVSIQVPVLFLLEELEDEKPYDSYTTNKPSRGPPQFLS
jgi:hypothetical protein